MAGKKASRIDQTLVREVRKISKARAGTEALTQALEEPVFREQVRMAFRRHGRALSGIEDVFPDEVLKGLRR